MRNKTHEIILVVDFGSQYSHLIARRIREQNVYSKIVSHKITPEEIKQQNPKGIILSGGPASVYVSDAPRCNDEILYMDIPILGICYGFQLGSQILGAEIKSSENKKIKHFLLCQEFVSNCAEPRYFAAIDLSAADLLIAQLSVVRNIYFFIN